jgi:hypothetical protein
MKKIPTIILFSAIFLIKLILYFAYFRVITYTPSWCNDFREGAFIPIVVGFLGIIFWFKIANILEHSIGKNKYINLIANNTYSIMINQFAGFMFIKTVFAFIAKYSNHFSDFNFNLYKTDIWYYYFPRGLYQFGILYLIAGVFIPIYIQILINFVKNRLKSKILV